MKKVYIETNGCSILRHDTQRYSIFFRLNDWEEVDKPEKADIILLTTCGVVQKTEDHSIESLKRLKKMAKKDSRIIVGGCLPKINLGRFKKVFNGDIFGRDEDNFLDELIGSKIKIRDVFWDGKKEREHSFGEPDLKYSKKQINELVAVETLSKKFNNPHYTEIYDYLTKGRFFWKEDDPVFEVKVSDGCSFKCSYCATKNAIGNLKSKSPQKILSEFEIGVKKGYSKIVLTGDEVGYYGTDIKTNLVGLLKLLVSKSENTKIALRYVAPTALIKYYSELKPFFKSGKVYYFCSSFQSGSQKILREMNRPDNIEEFLSIISDIKINFPHVFKHTQVIVGFPGETRDDFKKTIDAISDGKFEYVTIVQYSDRPKTKSIKMKNHVAQGTIKNRMKKALAVVSELREKNLRNLIFDEIINESKNKHGER